MLIAKKKRKIFVKQLSEKNLITTIWLQLEEKHGFSLKQNPLSFHISDILLFLVFELYQMVKVNFIIFNI